MWDLHLGRSGSLVDAVPFIQRAAGSNPALAATQGPWASPSLAVAEWHFGVKLRHRILAVSGGPLSSSGIEEFAIEII